MASSKKGQGNNHVVQPKRKRKGIHSKNNKPQKKYRGQGK